MKPQGLIPRAWTSAPVDGSPTRRALPQVVAAIGTLLMSLGCSMVSNVWMPANKASIWYVRAAYLLTGLGFLCLLVAGVSTPQAWTRARAGAFRALVGIVGCAGIAVLLHGIGLVVILVVAGAMALFRLCALAPEETVAAQPRAKARVLDALDEDYAALRSRCDRFVFNGHTLELCHRLHQAAFRSKKAVVMVYRIRRGLSRFLFVDGVDIQLLHMIEQMTNHPHVPIDLEWQCGVVGSLIRVVDAEYAPRVSLREYLDPIARTLEFQTRSFTARIQPEQAKRCRRLVEALLRLEPKEPALSSLRCVIGNIDRMMS